MEVKKFAKALAGIALIAGLSGCEDNHLKAERTAQTPMVVDLPTFQVNVYKNEQRFEQNPQCGIDYIGGGVVYRSCWVTVSVLDRVENLNVRVHFPVGSELSDGQTEQVEAYFYNNQEKPTEDHGFIDARIYSHHHKYEARSLKGVQVRYNEVNDIYVQLKN